MAEVVDEGHITLEDAAEILRMTVEEFLEEKVEAQEWAKNLERVKAECKKDKQKMLNPRDE